MFRVSEADVTLLNLTDSVQCPVTEGGRDAKVTQFSDQGRGVNYIESIAQVNEQHPDKGIVIIQVGQCSMKCRADGILR